MNDEANRFRFLSHGELVLVSLSLLAYRRGLQPTNGSDDGTGLLLDSLIEEVARARQACDSG